MKMRRLMLMHQSLAQSQLHAAHKSLCMRRAACEEKGSAP